MSRRRFSERDVIETLAWQRIFVTCYRCGMPFCEMLPDAKGNPWMAWQRSPEREHLHEVALGGPDTPKNCRYSCTECHKRVTDGTKATTAGSSKQRVAKAKRIQRGGKKSKRPFQKTLTRHFDGTITKR